MQVELPSRKRWNMRLELANAIFEYLETSHNRNDGAHHLRSAKPRTLMGVERADNGRCAAEEAAGTVLVCRARSGTPTVGPAARRRRLAGCVRRRFPDDDLVHFSVPAANALNDVEVDYDTSARLQQ